MDFAARLKEAREHMGISGSDLARALGITRSSISQWETGLTVPRMDRIAEVARVLDVAPEWLAGGTERGRPGDGIPITLRIAEGLYQRVGVNADYGASMIAASPAFPRQAQFAAILDDDSASTLGMAGNMFHCVNVKQAGLSPRVPDLVIFEHNVFPAIRGKEQLAERLLLRMREGSNDSLELHSTKRGASDHFSYDPGGTNDGHILAIVIGRYTPMGRGH